MADNSRINVPLPIWAKKVLEDMSTNTNISQASLIALASMSLIANYQVSGIEVIAKLLQYSSEGGIKTLVSLPDMIKGELATITEITKIPQYSLLSIATVKMLLNYQQADFRIFINLID